ncbi:MAG: hypothetical protein II394_05440 [Bacteroidales bacterium]|nr:hypothetical protein [Bacteroidales bacterium]
MPLANLLNRITSWFRERSERNQLVNDFNMTARQAFAAGYVPSLLKASVSRGCSDYRHSFSRWMASGFRICVLSGMQLSRQDIVFIGQAILSNEQLVRQLVVLGWDTLEVHCDVGNYGCRWALKEHLMLGS